MKRPPDFFRRSSSFAACRDLRPSKQAGGRSILFVGLGDLRGDEASKISELEAACSRGIDVALREHDGVLCFRDGAERASVPNFDCGERDDDFECSDG
jgi:hypothetical protein